MSDEEIFFNVLIPIVGIISGIVFTRAQYVLCITDPSTWFSGLVSGIVFAVCLWVRFRKRE